MPTVETVMRCGEIHSVRMSSAALTFSRLSSGSPMPMKTMLSPSARQAAVGADGQHLADDLAGGQVAAGAPVAGDAEGAGEGAAGLARDAEGAAAPLVGDVDRLDGGAVAQPEEVLAGAVRREVARGDLGEADAEAARRAGRAAPSSRSVISAKSPTARS